MNISEVYKKLTGVDINEQTSLWDERGKGYYGEFLVFQEIYKGISGCSKMLMNLEIPTPTGGTTELDLLLIHETGLYVFEVKHYKGTIYGKIHDKRWTQYFRTARNNSFKNPVEQNQYHINALQKLFPDIPIYSFVVFTSLDCELRITGQDEKIDIGTLNGLQSRMEHRFQSCQKILSIEDIDNIFVKLLPYSPDSDKEVTYNEKAVPFYQLAETIKEHADAVLQQQRVAMAKLALKVVGVTIAIGLAVLMGSVIVSGVQIARAEAECEKSRKEYEEISLGYMQKYAELAQKFVKVEHLNNGELVIKSDIATITECNLEPDTDVLNALKCDMWLQVTSDNYSIQIPKDAKMIVILKNGKVQEYEFWGKQHKYQELSSRISKTKSPVKLLTQEFYNVKKEDIAQIKMTGVILWRWKNAYGQREDVSGGMEITIYNAE